MKRSILSAGLALLVLVGGVRAGGNETAIVEKAMDVLDNSTKIPESGIPNSLLHKAQGVLIMPNVIKAGFLVGGRHGNGVLLVRTKDGGWSNPVFVQLTGGSFGWQGGVQSADLVLIFKSWAGVERILQGKHKITLGGDVSIAAGPVGRQSSAATDAMLKAEIFSYSRSRGLFLGLSLEGDSLRVDWRNNDQYYTKATTPAEIVGGNLLVPELSVRLRTLLTNLSVMPRAPVIVPGPEKLPPVPPVRIVPPTNVTPMKPTTGEPPLAPPPSR